MASRTTVASRKEVVVGAVSSAPPSILRSHLQDSRCSKPLCTGAVLWALHQLGRVTLPFKGAHLGWLGLGKGLQGRLLTEGDSPLGSLFGSLLHQGASLGLAGGT